MTIYKRILAALAAFLLCLLFTPILPFALAAVAWVELSEDEE